MLRQATAQDITEHLAMWAAGRPRGRARTMGNGLWGASAYRGSIRPKPSPRRHSPSYGPDQRGVHQDVSGHSCAMGKPQAFLLRDGADHAPGHGRSRQGVPGAKAWWRVAAGPSREIHPCDRQSSRAIPAYRQRVSRTRRIESPASPSRRATLYSPASRGNKPPRFWMYRPRL